MTMNSFSRPSDLRIGAFSVIEPKKSQPEILPDLLVAPFCGFDSDLYRLGFGSGYYDKYISEMRKK